MVEVVSQKLVAGGGGGVHQVLGRYVAGGITTAGFKDSSGDELIEGRDERVSSITLELAQVGSTVTKIADSTDRRARWVMVYGSRSLFLATLLAQDMLASCPGPCNLDLTTGQEYGAGRTVNTFSADIHTAVLAQQAMSTSNVAA